MNSSSDSTSDEEDDEEELPAVFRNVFNDSSEDDEKSLPLPDEEEPFINASSESSSSSSSSSSEEEREPPPPQVIPPIKKSEPPPQVIPPIKKRQRPQVPLYLRSPRRDIIPKFWFSKKEVRRNWLELPSDVMSMIFTKVGTIDILSRVQLVCSTWRKLAKDPHLFRSVDINDEEIPDELHDYGKYDMIEKLVKEAVDRSCGQLVDFSIEDYATDQLMKYIIDKQFPLRRLRLKSCSLTVSGFKYMAKKHPLLEKLEICYCEFGYTEKVIVNFGRYCPLLKSFSFDRDYRRTASDNIAVALAIAQNMPELRYLNLSWDNLTDNGLQAILDGCLHLKFLDLSGCFYLNFAGGLVPMCVERNIKLRVSGKKEQLKLITEMERQLLSLSQLQYKNIIPLHESLLQLQYEKPNCEHLEAGIETDDEELDDALSSYIKALHHTLTQMQSQLHTSTQMLSQLQKLYQVQSKIVSLLKSMPDG